MSVCACGSLWYAKYLWHVYQRVQNVKMVSVSVCVHVSVCICVCVWCQILNYSPPSGFEQKKNMRKKCPFLRKKTQFQQKKPNFLALYLFLKGYFVYLFYTKYPLSTCLKLLTTYSYSLIFQKPPILQNSKHL